MVNGRTLQEELKMIEQFFNDMDIDEFTQMAIECGAGTIKASEKSTYVLAMDSSQKYCYQKKKNYKIPMDFEVTALKWDMNEVA